MQTGTEWTERRLDEAGFELRGMATRMDEQGAEVERLTRAVAEGQDASDSNESDVLVWPREKVAKVIAQLRSKGLTMAYKAWVAYVSEIKDEHAEEAKIVAKQLLQDAADAYQAKASEEANRRIDTCKRFVQRILRLHLASSWAFFKESICTCKDKRKTVDKVLKRLSHRLLALALECYAGAVGIIISKREKVAKVMAQLRSKGLTMAYKAWVAYDSKIKDEQAEEANIVAKQLLKHVSFVSLSGKPKLAPVTPGKPRLDPFNRADLYRQNQQQKRHQTVDKGVSSTTNADFSSSIPPAVQLTSTLDMDISNAGEEGTKEREQFKRDVAADLAIASGAPPASFVIKKLSAGSVKVDMEIVAHPALTRTTEDMALDVEKQASDSNSLFCTGKLTKLTTSITHQRSPPPFSEVDGADEDEPNPAHFFTHLPGNMPHAETVSGSEVLVVAMPPNLPAENIKKPSRSDHACPQPGLDFRSWVFGAVAKAPATAKTSGYPSSSSPAAASLQCSTFPLLSPRSRFTFPPTPRQSKDTGGGEYVYESDRPSVPATPRPKIETIVPDPALGLLNCLCESKVLVCDTDHTTGPAFVYVCIDCGQMHHRAANQ